VLNGINRLAGYRATLIDMTNIPEDVPEGGYEPNVCPSPSLTRGIPYAMTGEITEDFETGGWAMRVYLWRMEGTRLIYSDRLTAMDRETCRLILPGLLDWIFGFLKEPESPVQLVTPGSGEGGVQTAVIYTPKEPNHWFYIGLRAGISMKMLLEPSDNIIPYQPIIEEIDPSKPINGIPHYGFTDVFNAAFTFAWMFPDNALFASPFGIQAEVLYNWDWSEHFNYMTIAFAGVLRTHLYREGKASIVLLTGGYFVLKPLETPNPRGFNNMITYGTSKAGGGFGLTAGISAGQKFGPGYLYLDVRWMGDLWATTFSMKDSHEFEGFKRHLVGLCIGYEFGIIVKKDKK
jgi:hypothetical protein